jgi:hypothetical protein
MNGAAVSAVCQKHKGTESYGANLPEYAIADGI